jgi:nucleotide-binding universal stress UspA family protein
MFKNILIPIDFTDKNLSALDRAYALAKWSKGSVTLLHVIEKVENIPAAELKDFYTKLELNAQKKMSEYVKTFSRRKIRVAQEIVYGKREQEIVRAAAAKDVDLIVVSSHKVVSATGWSTLSYRVAILSPCPVLLVK